MSAFTHSVKVKVYIMHNSMASFCSDLWVVNTIHFVNIIKLWQLNWHIRCTVGEKTTVLFCNNFVKQLFINNFWYTCGWWRWVLLSPDGVAPMRMVVLRFCFTEIKHVCIFIYLLLSVFWSTGLLFLNLLQIGTRSPYEKLWRWLEQVLIYRLGGLLSTQSTVSTHWRELMSDLDMNHWTLFLLDPSNGY